MLSWLSLLSSYRDWLLFLSRKKVRENNINKSKYINSEFTVQRCITSVIKIKIEQSEDCINQIQVKEPPELYICC